MREIKFRAWHKPFKKTKFGSEFVYGAKAFDFWNMSPDDYTLEQFTGLHDKNGKEIYEGDIVEFKTLKRSKNFGFENELVHDVVNYSDYSEWLVGNSLLSRIFNGSEVIGNVHENPELLEEK